MKVYHKCVYYNSGSIYNFLEVEIGGSFILLEIYNYKVNLGYQWKNYYILEYPYHINKYLTHIGISKRIVDLFRHSVEFGIVIIPPFPDGPSIFTIHEYYPKIKAERIITIAEWDNVIINRKDWYSKVLPAIELYSSSFSKESYCVEWSLRDKKFTSLSDPDKAIEMFIELYNKDVSKA